MNLAAVSLDHRLVLNSETPLCSNRYLATELLVWCQQHLSAFIQAKRADLKNPLALYFTSPAELTAFKSAWPAYVA